MVKKIEAWLEFIVIFACLFIALTTSQNLIAIAFVILMLQWGKINMHEKIVGLCIKLMDDILAVLEEANEKSKKENHEKGNS
jgi:hypothetical protein